MNFYIADMHFGHKNIIRYDNRPFGSVEEMDKALIQLWNETVGSDDIVYILGDFSWYKEDKTAFILGCLKGHKVLVKGNHDHISPKVARNASMQKLKTEMRRLYYLIIRYHFGMDSTGIQYTCMVMFIHQVSTITV